MNSIITNNIDKIKTVCDEHFVRTLFVFGSVCTDQFNAESDIDLLVSFEPLDFGDYADNYFQTAELLEQIFQRR
ncbi:MAG: nucleotidyltransferase domain-containing protein, partial [Planctomycetaceae bacterium]|nr:nucleotidyltransferase domain-containing protein [Planctomycetaceae bacterium]